MSKWLDRTLVQNPFHYKLFLNEKEYARELKKLNLPSTDFVSGDNADASVWFFDDTYAFVCVDDEGASPLGVYGLLIHEATHIWQWACESIGEESPGKEIEAYSIQAIAQELIESYNKQRKIKVIPSARK